MKNFPVILALLLAGCVSTVVPTEPLAEATLIVTRSGEEVFLQWASEPGVSYTVFYTDSAAAGKRWAPLAHAQNLRGTGEDIMISDRVAPGIPRRYRLHVETSATTP